MVEILNILKYLDILTCSYFSGYEWGKILDFFFFSLTLSADYYLSQ